MYNSNMKFMEKTCKMVAEWITQWDIWNSLHLKLLGILNPGNSDETAVLVQGAELSMLLWSSALNGLFSSHYFTFR